MKTYRNERHCFEIDIPSEWPNPVQVAVEGVIFRLGPNEVFNFQMGPMIPEITLDQTQSEFRRYAQNKNYADLEFGRITVQGKDHLWARYRMGHGEGTKKYMIVFGGTEYAITGTCYNPKTCAEKERIWDVIVTSFRKIPPAQANPPDEIEGVFQAYQFFEIGYGYFRAGRYQEALEQYEKGKLLTKAFPGNYFGVCMTVMQMIEIGAFPKDQIGINLEKAEKNVDECLRISPMQPDYLKAKVIIRDYKKKYQV